MLFAIERFCTSDATLVIVELISFSVTRLIKASKSSKPGSGIVGVTARSSSSLSLNNNQDSPSSRELCSLWAFFF